MKEGKDILDFLENSYSGAKMMNDEEIMLRISRAIVAFKGDIHKEIFSKEFLDTYCLDNTI